MELGGFPGFVSLVLDEVVDDIGEDKLVEEDDAEEGAEDDGSCLCISCVSNLVGFEIE